MANVTKVNGRLLYIEPNDLVALEGVHSVEGSNVSDSNHYVDGHFWNPEELNMSVDLQVIMPNREDCGLHSFNEIFTVEINNDNSTALGRYVSFMQGSELEGKSHDGTETVNIGNDLTTSYLSASYQEMYRDKKSDRECLGIESVDITFDSHFYPQVNIKFIDVRGYSLMMPTDEVYIAGQKVKNGKNDVQAGQFTTGYNNFFRALFRFPYPRFLLTIKGYYGNSITFILAVNEFKNNFNSETGNFEVTVSFIGYMYGLYTDVPLNFLICAPYYGMNLETGKEKGVFWNDDFRFDDGRGGSSNEPICTFIEYIKRCDSLNKEKEKYKSGETEHEDYNEAIKWKNEADTLEEILETLFKFTKSIATSSENSGDVEVLTQKEDGNIVALLCLGKTKDTEVIYDAEYWNSFVDKYEAYEENAETKLNASFPPDFYKDGRLLKSEPNKNKFKTDCDGFYIKNGDEFGENTNRTCDGASAMSLASLKEENPQIYATLENHNKRDWYSARQSFIDVYQKITQRISDLNTKISGRSTQNAQLMDDACEKALGFIPTINNYFRMLFAHLDCFMSGFYSMLAEISNSNRKLSDLGIAREMTDLNRYSTGDCFVPPFAALFKEEDNRRVEIYPGTLPEGKKMLEVKYVEALLSGALAAKNNAKAYIMESVNDKSYNDEISSNDGGDFKMTSLSDVFFDGSNPYSNFKKSPNDDDMFGELLYFFTCRYLQSRFQCGEDIDNIGLVEANNYISLHKNVPSKIFKDHLKTAKETPSKIIEELKNFYDRQAGGSLATVITISGESVTAAESDIAVFFSSDKKSDAVYYRDKENSPKLSQTFGFDRNTEIQRWKAKATESNSKLSDRIKLNINEFSTIVASALSSEEFKDGDASDDDDTYRVLNFKRNFIQRHFSSYGRRKNDDGKYNLSLFVYDLMETLIWNYPSNLVSGSGNNRVWKVTRSDAFKHLSEYIKEISKTSSITCVSNLTLMYIHSFLSGYYNDTNHFYYYWGDSSRGFQEDLKKATEGLSETLKKTAQKKFDDFIDTKEWRSIDNYLKQIVVEGLDPGENDDANSIYLRKVLYSSMFSNENKTYFYEIQDENGGDSIVLDKDTYIPFVNALYEAYNTQKSIEEANNNVVDENDITEAYKLEAYNALKNLYDKWINSYSVEDFKLRSPEMDYAVKTSRYVNDQSYYGFRNSTNGVKEYDNFVFIDSFYNDISSRFKINPDSVYKLIVDQLDNKSNYSTYEFMADICQKNRLLFLALPVLNNFYSKEGLENIFRPQINNTMKRGFGSTYVCMYTYEVSHVLEDESQTSMCDDGVTDLNGVAENTEPAMIANLFKKSASGMPLTIPAFGVTYARQNQQYFKSINVNMDNPRVTDYSIANLFELANWKNDGTLEKPYTIANDVYSIYANRSYNCSVEMLGCANIMPLMYFQLNNIPMFRGAYIITNVEHHIRAGNFSTLFTGVRVSRNQLPYSEDVFNIRQTIGMSSSMDGGLDTYDYTGGSITCEEFNVQNAINRMKLSMVVNTSKCPHKTIVPYNRTWERYGNQASCGYCVSAVKEFVKAGGERVTQWGDGYRGGEGTNPPIAQSGFEYLDSIPAGYTRQQMDEWCRQKCQAGDIAFMHHGASDTEAGHACMFDGTYWVSDFRQNHVYVYESGGTNSKPIKIFRHKNCRKVITQDFATVRLNGNKIYYSQVNTLDAIKTWWCSWEGGLDLTKPYEYKASRWGVSSYCGIQGFNFRPRKTKPDIITEEVYREALGRVFNGVSADIQRINDPALKLTGYFCSLWGDGALKHFRRKYGSLSAFANKCNANTDVQNVALLDEVKVMLMEQYNAGNIVPRDHWKESNPNNWQEKFEQSKTGIRRRLASITHEYAQLNS